MTKITSAVVWTTTLSLALWILARTMPAQSSVTIPKDAAYEGTGYSPLLGSYAEGRFQYVYTALRGKRHKLKQVAYRADYRNHNGQLSIARSWTNVTLRVSGASYAQLSTSFSLNPTGSVSVVFNAQVGWPTLSGLPVTYPDLWGSLTRKLRFPFTTPFTYAGNTDLLLDYTFRGGRLANGGAWGGPFPPQRHYFLDGEVVSTSLVYGLSRTIPWRTRDCRDSFFSTSTTPALVEGTTKVTGAAAGAVTVDYRTILTAPSAPVLHAVGLGGNLNGIPVGARCNRLHMDLTRPWVLTSLKTGPRFAGTPWTRHSISWTSNLSRLKIYIQGAWIDSQTSAFALTHALELILPAAPPPSQLPLQQTLYARFANATAAEVGPFYSAHIPYVSFLTQ